MTCASVWAVSIAREGQADFRLQAVISSQAQSSDTQGLNTKPFSFSASLAVSPADLCSRLWNGGCFCPFLVVHAISFFFFKKKWFDFNLKTAIPLHVFWRALCWSAKFTNHKHWCVRWACEMAKQSLCATPPHYSVGDRLHSLSFLCISLTFLNPICGLYSNQSGNNATHPD